MSAVPPCFLTLSLLTQTTREHLRRMVLLYSPLTLSAFRFQSYLPQTACQTVFQSMDPLPCHRIFCVLLFVITFYNYKIFKVIKHDKQHFLPCQVLIHDMQLSRRKNKRPDKIRIFLLSFYLISYSAFFTMFLTIVNSQIHLPWLQWQILFCNMGIRLCQTPDSPAHHPH